MSRTHGAAVAVSFLAFLAYLRTLCPTIAAGDSGELATAAATLGIAHPPGFPLWTVAGRLASLLAPAHPVTASNAFSALCAAGAAGLVVPLLHALTGRLLVSAGAALAFALSRAVWGTAVVTEVYALNLLVTVAALAAAVHGRRGHPRFLVLAAYVVGLGAANHPFALLAAPPVLLAATLPGEPGAARPRGAILAGAFVLGLTAYAFLPVRVGTGPEINWGGMRAASDVVDHVLRTQYGGLGEAGAHTSLALRWRLFGEVAGRSLPALLALAAVVGVGLLLRRRPIAPGLVLILFAVLAGPGTATVIRYEDTYLDRTVVTPFFLPAVLGLFLLAGVALAALEEAARGRLPGQPRAAALVGVALAVLPPAFLAQSNRIVCDRSGATVAQEYGVRLLESLPEGSRLYLEGDNALFALLYLQRLEGVRPDVRLMDRTLNLLVDAYGADFPAMSRAERRQAAVAREVEIASTEKDRSIFYADEPDLAPFGDCRLVPAGYVLQLLRAGEPPAPLAFEPAPLPPTDPDDFMEAHLAGVALYRQATWLAWTGRTAEAADSYLAAVEAAWNAPNVVRNCGVGRLELGDFAEAERLFLRTLELQPQNQDALYDLAVLCTTTGRPEEAIGWFERLDALETGLVDVPLNYALALLAAGRLAEAGAQAEKALLSDPELEAALRIREAVQRGLAIGGEAGLLEARRAVAPLTADGTMQLAQRYLDRGDWERALELYREAAREAPEEPRAAFGLGYALLRVGRAREAADAFRRILELEPGSADARNGLAYAFAEAGDSLAVAERLVKEALAADPDRAAYWNDTLGWIRHRARRSGEAVGPLTEAEAALPADDLSMRAENHYHLGEVMLALGRRDEARNYFRESALRARNEPWVKDLAARQNELGDREGS